MTAQIIYEGDLRCRCTHIQSQTVLETDAPTDNRGKGERFSPTDTICVGLATCIITTMGIRAVDMGINLSQTELQVTKHMQNNPRRIAKIEVVLHLPGNGISAADQETLQVVGDNCPVMKSLHPDINVQCTYLWGQTLGFEKAVSNST